MDDGGSPAPSNNVTNKLPPASIFRGLDALVPARIH
jgi:hypothetical protein